MPFECELKRYSAYFRGWCQAFGEFDNEYEEQEITWLLGVEQVGLILPERVRRQVYKEVLGKNAPTTLLTISDSYFQVGDTRLDLSGSDVREAMAAVLQAFQKSEALHLYLTYHLLYPSGTRFVTLSKLAPLRIIYKEIEPMIIRIE